jgi:hypothetical protein
MKKEWEKKQESKCEALCLQPTISERLQQRPAYWHFHFAVELQK